MLYVYTGLAIALIIVILLLPYFLNFSIKDHFVQNAIYYPDNDYDNDNYVYDPAFNTHTNFAFWNTQKGTKSGMSYDLRGDVPIGSHQIFPFNMATTVPIQNKPLYMVS